MRVTRELEGTFGKSSVIEHSRIEIRVSKKFEMDSNDVPVYAAALIMVPHYQCKPSEIAAFTEALAAAKAEAEWLDENYPTGQKLFKD